MPGSSTISFTNEGKGISGWKLPDANGNYDENAAVAYKTAEAFTLPESITETLTMQLYAVWAGKYYTVNHYKHNLVDTSSDYATTNDSSYTLTNTDVIYTDDTTTNAAARNYNGFYVNTDDRAFSQTDVAEDNSTVINIYYERNLVTITFVPNGGTVNFSVFYGEEFDSNNNSAKGRYGSVLAWYDKELIIRNGYTLSWKDANPSDTIESYRYRYPANDIVYEAEWEPTVYTITYNNLNGTDNSNAVTSYTVLDSFDLSHPQNLSGYNFAGWYSDSALTTQVSSITAGTTGNLTLYAKWTPTGSIFTDTIHGAGDMVYSDGTYIHYIDGLDVSSLDITKVAGVIVFNLGTDDSSDWRCIGLNTGYGNWSNENNSLTDLSPTRLSDGFKSNELFETYKTTYSGAVFYCYNFAADYGSNNSITTGSYSDDWYVPSLYELSLLMNVMSTINATRKLLGYADLSNSVWSCNTAYPYFSSRYQVTAVYENGYAMGGEDHGISTGRDRSTQNYSYFAFHKVQ